MGLNNLPKVATRQHSGRGLISLPMSHQSDALAARLLSHTQTVTSDENK